MFYLSLVTDLYSHKILGWSIGPTLDTTYPLEALRMALAMLPEGDTPYLIHHSDRGCQYCSHAYVEVVTPDCPPVMKNRVSIKSGQL